MSYEANLDNLGRLSLLKGLDAPEIYKSYSIVTVQRHAELWKCWTVVGNPGPAIDKANERRQTQELLAQHWSDISLTVVMIWFLCPL